MRIRLFHSHQKGLPNPRVDVVVLDIASRPVISHQIFTTCVSKSTVPKVIPAILCTSTPGRAFEHKPDSPASIMAAYLEGYYNLFVCSSGGFCQRSHAFVDFDLERLPLLSLLR